MAENANKNNVQKKETLKDVLKEVFFDFKEGRRFGSVMMLSFGATVVGIAALGATEGVANLAHIQLKSVETGEAMASLGAFWTFAGAGLVQMVRG